MNDEKVSNAYIIAVVKRKKNFIQKDKFGEFIAIFPKCGMQLVINLII